MQTSHITFVPNKFETYCRNTPISSKYAVPKLCMHKLNAVTEKPFSVYITITCT